MSQGSEPSGVCSVRMYWPWRVKRSISEFGRSATSMSFVPGGIEMPWPVPNSPMPWPLPPKARSCQAALNGLVETFAVST